MKRCAEKHDLYSSIEFGREVTAIRHDGAEWRIAFKDGSSSAADFVVSGLGGLHKPNIPDFDGREKFSGPVFHTAEWRDDVDLTGKRVAVIGSAASAIQVIPEIVDAVAHLDVYQRTPNWIIPREDYGYPKWLRSVFSAAPFLARAYRGFYFSVMEWRFPAFHKDDNRIKKLTRRRFLQHLERAVTDPDLRSKLTPHYPIGCKRILISDDYFDAMQKPNVDLVTEGIASFTDKGIRTKDGEEHEADVVILATGFKPFDILDTIEVKGQAGASLKDAWKNGIAAHRTVMAPGFPNFFLLLGPNSALGHNSVILMIEAQVNYIIQLVRRATGGGQGAPSLIEPSGEAATAFDRKIQADLQRRVWAAQCGAWYVDENGRNYTLYPHNVRHYLRAMKEVDLMEYEIKALVSSPES